MNYTGSFPPLRLSQDDMKRFEEILLKGCAGTAVNEIKEEIELAYGGFSKDYSNVVELMNDPNRPNYVSKIEWYLKCDSGDIRLWNDAPIHRLEISGNDDWVLSKKVEILQFLKRKKRTIFIFKHWWSKSAGMLMIILSGSFLPSVYPLFGLKGLFGDVTVILLGIALFLSSTERFVHYAIFELEKIEKRRWAETILLGIVSGLIALLIGDLIILFL